MASRQGPSMFNGMVALFAFPYCEWMVEAEAEDDEEDEEEEEDGMEAC